MEKELKANILRMTQNATWAVQAMPKMLEKGMRVLSNEQNKSLIAAKGREDAIHFVAFKLIDEYH